LPTGACVYIDARPISCRRFTGIARYTARLALALAAHVPVRFFSCDEEVPIPRGLSWAHDQDLARWARQIVRGARRPLGTPPEGSIGVYPAIRPAERLFPFEVSVLHDFSPLILPGTHTEQTRKEYKEFFATTVLSSDVALAVSHSTKADAAWLSPIDPARVVVAHNGPSLCINEHMHHGEVQPAPNVGLVVSTLEPRKNAGFLLEWFQQTKVLPAGEELWWVGPLGWLTSRRQLRRLGYSNGGRRVRFLGVVSDARLCELYQQAAWSIYPSLYEGFGLPVVDALRHGTPVLTSGNSSLREFESPGLHFFDPCDSSSVDDAWRALQAAGPVTIPKAPLDSLYNWDRVARTLLDHYARAQPDAKRSATRAA
jgi:glycosyltransferase involved in cell wall biosynthesis